MEAHPPEFENKEKFIMPKVKQWGRTNTLKKNKTNRGATSQAISVGKISQIPKFFVAHRLFVTHVIVAFVGWNASCTSTLDETAYMCVQN